MFDKEDEKAMKEYPEDYSIGYKHGRESYLGCYPHALMFDKGKHMENSLQKLSWTLGVCDGYADEDDADCTTKLNN